MRNISKGTVLRTILMVLALINQVLSILGYHVLPFSDDQVTQLVDAAFLIGTTVYGFWKNNSFTTEAREAQDYLKKLRASKTLGIKQNHPSVQPVSSDILVENSGTIDTVYPDEVVG